MTTRIVELRRGILKKNDELAAGLRGRYGAAGVLVLNLVSSPGTGKTALAKSLANTVQGTSSRIQFTPDLLPSGRREQRWPRWWAIWRPTTTRAVLPPAALPYAKSIRMAFATSTRR